MSNEEVTQQTADAITNLFLTRAAERGHYNRFMDQADRDGTRAGIEASAERHATTQRKAGRPGW